MPDNRELFRIDGNLVGYIYDAWVAAEEKFREEEKIDASMEYGKLTLALRDLFDMIIRAVRSGIDQLDPQVAEFVNKNFSDIPERFYDFLGADNPVRKFIQRAREYKNIFPDAAGS